MSNQKSILLVDDDDMDLELTTTAIEQAAMGNDIITLRDGQETLDYLYRRGRFSSRPPGNPPLILLDLKLPKVDGLEVLRKVKSDDQLKTIPIVMLTSSKQEKDIRNSYDFGVNAYVVKPVDFKELLSAIKELVLFWSESNVPPPESGTK